MSESPENRLKRLRMRSWRRGTKEMDMILGPFSDAALDRLESEDLDRYESLLAENDQDLYAWYSGRGVTPGVHEKIIAIIKQIHAH